MSFTKRWDKINNWLTFGSFTFMFDNWFNWFNKKPTIKEFNFFTITWDTGAWWGSETERVNNNVLQGNISHFFQVVFLGFGIRINWKRNTIIVLPNFEEILTATKKEALP